MFGQMYYGQINTFTDCKQCTLDSCVKQLITNCLQYILMNTMSAST